MSRRTPVSPRLSCPKPLGLVLAALAALASPLPTLAQSPLQVVMSGLSNPRGLSFGPDGGLYVAEAGTGGPGASIRSADGSTISYGATGAVSRLLNGTQTRVITGLPSLADQTTTPAGVGSTGLQDIGFGPGGVLYGVIGLGADTSEQAVAGPGFDTLVRLTLGSSGFQTVADLGAYETQNNPDGTDRQSNPYGLAVLPGGGFAVADAAANDVVGVSAGGTVSTLAVLPIRTGGGVTFESVPTAAKVGPDGALYIGELTGYPYPAGAADVFRLDPTTGLLTVYASGFTNITDLTFGADGRLYVLDLSTNGLTSPQGPGSGALIQVDPATGAHTTLVGQGLSFPIGLAQGPDGAFYISNQGSSPGGGQVLRFAPSPEPSSVAALGLGVLGLAGLLLRARRERRCPRAE